MYVHSIYVPTYMLINVIAYRYVCICVHRYVHVNEYVHESKYVLMYVYVSA